MLPGAKDAASTRCSHCQERPADDAARLIYADWLEEHGATAHGEFIRVQIELARRLDDAAASRLAEREQKLLAEGADGGRSAAWDWMGQHVEAMVPYGVSWEKHVTFRRGFVAGIRCSLEQWCSVPIPCRQCVGRGVVADQPCSLCQGRMVNLGHGPAACLTQPLEWVEAADKAPLLHRDTGEAFWFGPAARFHSPQNEIPGELFDLFPEGTDRRRLAGVVFPHVAAAQAALSAALLLWTRRQAGLPDRP